MQDGVHFIPTKICDSRSTLLHLLPRNSLDSTLTIFPFLVMQFAQIDSTIRYWLRSASSLSPSNESTQNHQPALKAKSYLLCSSQADSKHFFLPRLLPNTSHCAGQTRFERPETDLQWSKHHPLRHHCHHPQDSRKHEGSCRHAAVGSDVVPGASCVYACTRTWSICGDSRSIPATVSIFHGREL